MGGGRLTSSLMQLPEPPRALLWENSAQEPHLRSANAERRVPNTPTTGRPGGMKAPPPAAPGRGEPAGGEAAEDGAEGASQPLTGHGLAAAERVCHQPPAEGGGCRTTGPGKGKAGPSYRAGPNAPAPQSRRGAAPARSQPAAPARCASPQPAQGRPELRLGTAVRDFLIKTCSLRSKPTATCRTATSKFTSSNR